MEDFEVGPVADLLRREEKEEEEKKTEEVIGTPSAASSSTAPLYLFLCGYFLFCLFLSQNVVVRSGIGAKTDAVRGEGEEG